MDLPQLSEEQLQHVREFFSSDAATLLWRRLEAAIMADWLISDDPVKRDLCWHEMQVCLRLQASLRDATANQKLDGRAQNARTTGNGSPRSHT